MKKSMQTHFDGVSIGIPLCLELVELGVEHFRMDGQNRTVNECASMLYDADSVGVDHLIILNSHEMLSELNVRNIEWMNEPNGRSRDTDREVKEYHHSFMVAYELCKPNRHTLYGPAISNTNQKSIDWLNKFMDLGVPEDVIITYHTYRDDMRFDNAHKGFKRRGEPGEMRWIVAAAAGRQIACSEVGYDSSDGEEVANNIVKEFALAEEFNALFCTYFQLNDDVLRGLHFGARYPNGLWKPVMKAFARHD